MVKIKNIKNGLFLNKEGIKSFYSENGTLFTEKEAESIVKGRFARNLIIVK